MKENLIIITGNLTRDPELSYTPAGDAVCKIDIAHNEGYGDKERVSFHRVEFWKEKAEAVAKHFKKGSGIYIQGSLSQDEWTDKETGKSRRSTLIKGWKWQFNGPKPEGQGDDRQERRERPEARPARENMRNTTQDVGLDDDDLNSIPF